RVGQQEARHAVGERGFADAGGAAEQPGMGKPAALIGRQQRALRLAMAVEHRGRARRRRLALVVLAHRAARARSADAVAGLSRSPAARLSWSGNAALGGGASSSSEPARAAAASG